MTTHSRSEISVQAVRERMGRRDDFLLLDVRQAEEFAICRIDGGILVPLPDLPTRVSEVLTLAAGRPIVTYCHHGVRSLEAAANLRRAGVADVRSMAGGIDAWAEEIDPGMARY